MTKRSKQGVGSCPMPGCEGALHHCGVRYGFGQEERDQCSFSWPMKTQEEARK
jgi:hypothetical protein